MAKRKPVLRWKRNRFGHYLARPFSISKKILCGFDEWALSVHFDDAVATIYCATLSDAKAHADGLARCILTATQKAKQANTQDLAAELAAAKQKLKFREAGWRAAYAQACGANSNFDALAKMAGHKLPTGLTRVDLRAVAGGPNQEFKCDT